MTEPMILKPGQKAVRSGQYVLVDAAGNPYPGSGEATITRGEPGPPTPHAGLAWRLQDASRRAHEEQDKED